MEVERSASLGARRVGGLLRRNRRRLVAHTFVVLTALSAGLAVLATAQLFSQRSGFVLEDGSPIGLSFTVFWGAAKAAAQGELPVIFDRVAFWEYREALLGQDFPFRYAGAWLYPLHYLLFVAPLAFVPYLAGYALFSGGTLIAHLVAAWRLGLRRWGLIFLLLAPSTFFAVRFGENGFLTAALLVPGVMLIERRPRVAGALFGTLTYKPTMGVLVIVALLATRAWRAVAYAAGVSVALVLVATLAYGVHAWDLLLHGPLGDQLEVVTSEPGYARGMVSVFPRAYLLLDGSAAAYAVQGVFTVLAVAVIYRVFRLSGDPATRTLAVAAGTCLATPYLFVYDLPMLSLALALYVQDREIGTGHALLLLPLWFLPFVSAATPLVVTPALVTAALMVTWWQVEQEASGRTAKEGAEAAAGTV